MIEETKSLRHHGKRLDRLVYVELENGNGGMMLTLSEEGFSMRVMGPVTINSNVHFSFSTDGTNKLEGIGRVEWTEEEGKVACLRFEEVSPAFGKDIRRWLVTMGAPAPPRTAEPRSDRRASKPDVTPVEPSDVLEETTQDFSPRDPQPIPVRQNGFGTGSSFEPARPPETSTANSPSVIPPLYAWEPERVSPTPLSWLETSTETSNSGVRRVAIVVIFLALLALAPILIFSYREPVGHWLISIGQQLAAGTQTPPKTPPPKPASASEETSKPTAAETDQSTVPPPHDDSANSRTPVSTADSRPSRPGSSSRASKDVAESRATEAPRASEEVDTGQAEWRAAQQIAHGPNAAVRNSEVLRLLWTAVSKGNTSAEIDLAKIYAAGRGVTKNCDQARVLFTAAAKKGSAEAHEDLLLLPREGCP
ncbi:MAG: hypothetical protein NVS9B4_12930 [Candidatus Acidiferrum sp.]